MLNLFRYYGIQLGERILHIISIRNIQNLNANWDESIKK
jgi:hypothetical protein